MVISVGSSEVNSANPPKSLAAGKMEASRSTPHSANISKACLLFFPIEKALEIITYSQDKSLVMMAYQKYKELY